MNSARKSKYKLSLVKLIHLKNYAAKDHVVKKLCLLDKAKWPEAQVKREWAKAFEVVFTLLGGGIFPRGGFDRRFGA